MADNGQINLGDAVRYRLPNGTSLYGIVERLRPASSSMTGVRVAFPAAGISAAPVHLDCDLGLLQPMPGAELRAFLAMNIDGPMSLARPAANAAPGVNPEQFREAAPRRAARS